MVIFLKNLHNVFMPSNNMIFRGWYEYELPVLYRFYQRLSQDVSCDPKIPGFFLMRVRKASEMYDLQYLEK